MTAVTRVALACGTALVMVTAALGGFHAPEKPDPVATVGAPAATAPAEAEMPSASELDVVTTPATPLSTR